MLTPISKKSRKGIIPPADETVKLNYPGACLIIRLVVCYCLSGFRWLRGVFFPALAQRDQQDNDEDDQKKTT
jgi:hypothetical protein